MNRVNIFKRLYKDYSKKYLNKIILSALLSILVAASTSSIAWLLDPAIKKIFIEKDQSLLLIIPLSIILAFAVKGISVCKEFLNMLSCYLHLDVRGVHQRCIFGY